MGLVLAFNRRNAQPEFQTPASISGTVREGQSLTASWDVIRAREERVEWTSYTDIAATQNPRLVGQSTDLLVPSSDVGRYLVCRVYASNAAGSVVSVAGPTIAVESANAPDPYFSVLPSLSGNAVVGETMTLSYTPVNAITEQRQWYAYTNPGGDQTGRLTLGTGLTQSIPAGADGYYIGALVQLFDADGDMAEDHTDLVGPVTPGAADPGAPELPRVTPSHLPPAGWDGAADVTLTDATSLQTWLNANAPIDTSGGNYIVELTAGDTWADKITMPGNINTGENWVIFRTSGYANLPAAGNRLQPAPANNADLAVIRGNPISVHTPQSITASGSTATITFASPHGLSSSYYNIDGVEVASGANPYNKWNVYCTVASTTTLTYPLGSTPTDLEPTGGTMVRTSAAGERLIDAASPVKKLAFIGVQFQPDDYAFSNQQVYFPSSQNDGLCFYQCRFTTGSIGRVRDTMLMPDGKNVTVSCCDFYVRRRDFYSANVKNAYNISPNDGCFAIRVLAGAGIRIYNNRLQAGGCSIFIADSNNTYQPTDLTIDKNYLYRPIEWVDLEQHKNAFESKGHIRLLFEGNIVETTWQGDQNPARLLYFKNNCRYSNDTMIRKNIFRVGDACIGFLGWAGTQVLEQMSRVTVEHNLFYGIDDNLGTNHAFCGMSLYWAQSAAHLRFNHNTLVASSGHLGVVSVVSSPKTVGFQFKDNVFAPTSRPPYNNYLWGWYDDAIGTTTRALGLAGLNRACIDYDIRGNVWTYRNSTMLGGDAPSSIKDGSTLANNYYYIGNHLQVGPSASEALFVDYDNENYRINPAGSLATVATDGGAPGADIDEVEAATANVETGTLT